MTVSQAMLFGDTAPEQTSDDAAKLVRRRHPDTAREAAERTALSLQRNERIFLRSLKALGRRATAYEVAIAQTEWPNKETIRKRAGRLKDNGFIRRADREGRTPSGGPCERFELTEKGLRYLAEGGQ